MARCRNCQQRDPCTHCSHHGLAGAEGAASVLRSTGAVGAGRYIAGHAHAQIVTHQTAALARRRNGRDHAGRDHAGRDKSGNIGNWIAPRGSVMKMWSHSCAIYQPQMKKSKCWSRMPRNCHDCDTLWLWSTTMSRSLRHAGLCARSCMIGHCTNLGCGNATSKKHTKLRA